MMHGPINIRYLSLICLILSWGLLNLFSKAGLASFCWDEVWFDLSRIGVALIVLFALMWLCWMCLNWVRLLGFI